MAGGDTADTEAPPGWTVEEAADDVRSWIGPEERAVCARVADGDDAWTAYAQPRGELAAPAKVPPFDAPAPLDETRSAAREYVARSGDAE